MSKVGSATLAALLAAAWALEAAAQAPVSPARERQNALFEQMRRDPENLELMFAYAAAALEANDLEAAIATYERMLIFNPNLPRVQLELGVAYFRLGSYEVSRFYFERALAADPPEEVRARVQPFLAEIDERTRTERLAGFISVGGVYSTNATLGPNDRDITFFIGGQPFDGLLSDSATSSDSFGFRLSAGINHTADLGRPNEDVWETSAIYAGLRYFSEDAGDFDVFDIVTGPRLSLDERQFGPKARPFLQFGHVRSANDPLYWLAGAGVEYADTYSDTVNLFAIFSGQQREYSEAGDFDGFYGSLFAGAAYSGVEDTVFRLGVGLDTDRTDRDFQSNYEVLARGSVTHQLREAAGTLAGPLTLSAFGQFSRRFFDEPDPQFDPNDEREDWEGRFGARAYAPVSESYGVAVDASYFRRHSTYDIYVLDSFEVGVSFVATF